MDTKTKKSRGRSRAAKPRSTRGRGRPPRARVSGKKACVIESDPEDVETVVHNVVIEEDQCSFQVPGNDEIQEIVENKIELLNEVIVEKNEPIMALNWSHKVNLIGEKVINPLIHCCDLCTKPILVYGRMIPCKHVFCLTCSKQDLKQCPRCSEKISRVESSGLGSVFMCTHDGSRYGNDGCRRTYLSQRDLQAHINHRHVHLPTRM